MDLILQIGAVFMALTAVGVAARAVWKAWKRVDAFLEDWNGEPERPGRRRTPSMPERVAGVESRLTQVEAAIHKA